MHASIGHYLRNSGWLLADQALRALSGFAVGIYVARYLGSEWYGSLNYAVAFVAIFSAIARLGLDAVVIRGLVADPAQHDILLGTTFWLRAAAAVLTVAAIVVSVRLVDESAEIQIYVILIACGIVVQTIDVTDLDFQAKALSKYSSLCRMAQTVASAFARLALVYMEAPLVAFVAMSLIDQFVFAAALIVAYRRHGAFLFLRHFDRRMARSLLASAMPLFVSSIMAGVYYRLDHVIVMDQLGSRAVGIYSAGLRLTEALYVIPVAVTTAFFPALLAARGTGRPYEALLSGLYKGLLTFALVTAIVVSAGSARIVHVLFGADFADAGAVLAVHAWILVPLCFSSVLGRWLVAEGLQDLMPRMAFAALATNIASILLLAPLLGVVGVAVAAVVTQLVPIALYLSLYPRLRTHLRRTLLSAP
ncbi:MAG TPA: flippase [Burkholderiales bacterium]|nr:flippase [Burkholderiales bacterium]